MGWRSPGSTLSHVVLALSAACLAGCYGVRSSQGGGQTTFQPPRKIDAADIALPTGYHIERLATGLTFPTSVVLDDQNRMYVVESGYSYRNSAMWAMPSSPSSAIWRPMWARYWPRWASRWFG